ncbi:MAG: hypothetical protein ACRBCL_13705 [Maritimibacter sp.]
MTTFLPKEILDGLDAARKQSKKKETRLRVVVGYETYPVLEMHEHGFALDLENAPHLRGFVDLYRGADHLYQCLVVASHEEGRMMRYDFKRHTAAADKAPVDYARTTETPIALLEHTAKA